MKSYFNALCSTHQGNKSFENEADLRYNAGTMKKVILLFLLFGMPVLLQGNYVYTRIPLLPENAVLGPVFGLSSLQGNFVENPSSNTPGNIFSAISYFAGIKGGFLA